MLAALPRRDIPVDGPPAGAVSHSIPTESPLTERAISIRTPLSLCSAFVLAAAAAAAADTFATEGVAGLLTAFHNAGDSRPSSPAPASLTGCAGLELPPDETPAAAAAAAAAVAVAAAAAAAICCISFRLFAKFRPSPVPAATPAAGPGPDTGPPAPIAPPAVVLGIMPGGNPRAKL